MTITARADAPTNRPAQRGLTMIEVLAAMVIFSAGAVVLFGWIGQAADRMGRLAVEQKQLFAELAALEFAKSLNPMRQPTGTINVAQTELHWTSTAIGVEKMAREVGGTDGAYMVQLYRVRIEALAQDGSAAERSLLLAGWRQTRPVRRIDPFGNRPSNAAPAPTSVPGPTNVR